MGLLDIFGAETGLLSSTLANSEFDAASVVAGGTLQAASVAHGANSSYSLQAATGGTSGVAYGERDWGSDEATVYFECCVRYSSVPSAITSFASIYDSSPAAILDLRVNASGKWSVYNYGNTTTYTSTGQTLLQNVWYRIELKLFGDANGTIDVKVNGVLEPGLNGISGINTKPGGLPRRYRLGVTAAQANAGTRYLDDAIVRNDDWVGNGLVLRLWPMGNDAANWTVVDSGAESWSVMRDAPWASNNTGMIKSSTANQEERYILAPVGFTSTGAAFLGLLPVVRHKRSVGGSAAAVVVSIKSGGSGGSTASLDAGSTTWTTKRGVVQATDPATGVAWTLSGLNAAILVLAHDAGTNEANVNACLVYLAYTANGGQVWNPAASQKRGTASVGVTKMGNIYENSIDRYIRRGRPKHKVS